MKTSIGVNLSHKDLKTLRIQWCPKTPEEVMEQQQVGSYKSLDSGIAIRKGGQWKYYEFNGQYYIFTGSTQRLRK